jgi:23S rRNA (adenine-N6)-dimethyltransferase
MARHGRRSSVFGRRGFAHDEQPLSQHFLHSARFVRQLVAEMRLPPGTLTLDIGAGGGIITQALADAGCRVVAIERDPRLYRSLRERFVGRTNVECHFGDALAYRLPREPYAVVSNVPFAITAALVRRLLDAPNPPRDAWLILQREAAMKFAGVPSETLFSLLYQPRFSFEIVRALEQTDYRLAPRVETVLFHVKQRRQPLVTRRDAGPWGDFVRACFFRSGAPDIHTAMRPFFTRRQLVALASEHGFDPRSRTSTLTFGQWLAMFRFHARACRGPTGSAWRTNRLHIRSGSPIMGALPRRAPCLQSTRGAS